MTLQPALLGPYSQFQPINRIGIAIKLVMVAMHSGRLSRATSKKIMVQRHIKMSLVINPSLTADVLVKPSIHVVLNW